MLGFSAYANTSNIIDQDLLGFKSQVENIKGLNKQLQSEAGQKADLDTIQNAAQEFGIKQGKDLLAKYGAKAYTGRIPFSNTTIKDLDFQAGEALDTKLKSVGNFVAEQGKGLMSKIDSVKPTFDNQQFRLNDGVEDDFFDKGFGDMNVPEVQEGNDFAEFVRQQAQNQGITPVEDLVQPSQAGRSQVSSEVEMSKPNAELNQEPGEIRATAEDVVKPETGGVSEVEMSGLGKDVGKGAVDIAEDVGADVGESLAGIGAEEAATQATAGGFAATGILAPVGAAISVAGDLFALFEAGKTLADFVGRDILHTSQVEAPQVELPKNNMISAGFGITPSIDSYDIPHQSLYTAW